MLESEGRSSSYARLSVGGVLREGVVLEALAVLLERRDVPDAGAGLVRAPLLAAEREVEPVPYAAGTLGPEEANALLEGDGRHWYRPGPDES